MIGILGGTFDPVHIGHLRLAIEAFENYALEKIMFIPCRKPVHKKNPCISPEHRIAMLELALEPHRNFQIDFSEINRKTKSYMVETLRELSAKLPDKKLGLILGEDAVRHFHHWRGYKEILCLAELIILPRVLKISSSGIREILKNPEKTPRYLLPERVLDYIEQYKLYA